MNNWIQHLVVDCGLFFLSWNCLDANLSSQDETPKIDSACATTGFLKMFLFMLMQEGKFTRKQQQFNNWMLSVALPNFGRFIELIWKRIELVQ